MYFFILGSIEVRSSGGRIPITAPKQRAVLATLILNANTEVPVDRFIKYVWDGQPPVGAQTTLQSYVYRLRQALRPLAGVEIATGSASYMLQVGSGETDLCYFKQQIGNAHAEAQRGRLSSSVQIFRDALGVWRGNALAGVQGELIQQEARFLESERIAAYEELYGSEIALGNYRQVIPELQKRVVAYPFHEAMRSQLMTALYCSGQQAEALQHYTLIRKRLSEELGIEPGSELQELQLAILERVPAKRLLSESFPAWPIEGTAPSDFSEGPSMDAWTARP
ncbi:AfsR/SARP family transcriptional regulator [Nonomuraea sp. NPDC005650]|uniref:AfsR/SARP family transcriptional regulator n=1 Tax=Nonomuraea sp. NPDC005650 TaxID=3157045 RepID=UPI0033B7C9ED